MGNIANKNTKVLSLPEARRKWLLDHKSECEALRVRWQQTIFKTVVTFLSICAPLTVTAVAIQRVGGVALVLLKCAVATAVLATLAGLVVTRADLHTKERFVSKAIELINGRSVELCVKYLWYEVACVRVMVGAFVASVLLLLAAVAAI